VSDYYEVYKSLREERAEESRRNREQSTDEFSIAARLASANGLALRRHSDSHYALEHIADGWLINVYPGNQRLYMDQQRPKAPYLRLRGELWNLADVVSAAIAAETEVK
jgi:hypothetical protein